MNARMVFSGLLLICGTTCIAGSLALASYIGHESAMLQAAMQERAVSLAATQGAPVNWSANWRFEGTAEGLMWGALGMGAILLLVGLWQGFVAAAPRPVR